MEIQLEDSINLGCQSRAKFDKCIQTFPNNHKNRLSKFCMKRQILYY